MRAVLLELAVACRRQLQQPTARRAVMEPPTRPETARRFHGSFDFGIACGCFSKPRTHLGAEVNRQESTSDREGTEPVIDIIRLCSDQIPRQSRDRMRPPDVEDAVRSKVGHGSINGSPIICTIHTRMLVLAHGLVADSSECSRHFARTVRLGPQKDWTWDLG